MPQAYKVETRIRQQRVSKIYYKGEMRNFLIKGNRILFSKKPVKLPQTLIRITGDINGDWMEIGFLSSKILEGDAATGWTDPGHYLNIQIQNSIDLVNWSDNQFIPAEIINNGDGTYYYWSRSLLPKNWNQVIADLHSTSSRYGKSITAVRVAGTLLSLPGYPYAMPAAAATLQTHLRAAGHPSATVTTTAAALTCSITNYTIDTELTPRIEPLIPTVNGSSQVTAVRYNNSLIPLPSYPYALPSAAATLQTDLRAAGYSGAVVGLLADTWAITLPDVTLGEPFTRSIALTITPGDPYPTWDAQGNYLGLNPDDQVGSTYTNLRSTTGTPRQEADKQFARLLLTKGTRFDYLNQ